ncbi:hypothetical protein GOARA_087_00130 [Gordonia araii NBRC 100433]|uniref:Acetyltransferase n=1 Tax=Gordonia araii NBRC 100433 TaxID=1073574 RepID=G7H795_9ACTN|nr:hypothetical protein [Gordonia araii]GAB11720.1 hypothetical protein GOARA_087_00130 [Gordonia araii NBRC 100433]
MGIRLLALDTDGFERLPRHVRGCVFWEVDPSAGVRVSEFDKEAWTSGLLLEWGTCAQLAQHGSNVMPAGAAARAGGHTVVGTAFYAPPARVPRAAHFPTSPVSADAVLLMSMHTVAGFEDVRAMLIDAVVADLVQRGVRAVEAFGIRRPVSDGDDVCLECMIDADFLENSGFDLVAPHHRFPRYRLVLDEGLGWKSAVEGALERLVVEAALKITIEEPRREMVPALRASGRTDRMDRTG